MVGRVITPIDRPWLASYAPDVPHEIDLPRGSLVDMVDRSVDRFPDGTAFDSFGAEIAL
jgi:long-chain acyl-CoA synthetase